MLDPGWTAAPAADGEAIDFDPPAHRRLARQLAEESAVLLANRGGVLPLTPGASIAVIGPLAADPLAFFGCYSLPRHLGSAQPEAAATVPVTPLLNALRAELSRAGLSYARGCDVNSGDRSGFPEAIEAARSADVAVLVLGDQAGLFGQGTSGEGCDAADLRLPGPQDDLLQAVTAAGTPVILVLVTGRPYAVGHVAGELSAIVQAFFPGEEGGTAISAVLSGRVNSSGKLPVQLPRSPGGQPSTYLRSRLADRHPGSSVDPTPLFAFGHGLSYTRFTYTDLAIRPDPVGGTSPGLHVTATDGLAEITCTVRNTGTRPGAEVVQLYLSDPVAQAVRPARWLAGFARITLEPGQARQVAFRLHADRTAFHGRNGHRIVEPGEIQVAVGGSSDSLPLHGSFWLHGPERHAGADRVLDTPAVTRHVPGAEYANVAPSTDAGEGSTVVSN